VLVAVSNSVRPAVLPAAESVRRKSHLDCRLQPRAVRGIAHELDGPFIGSADVITTGSAGDLRKLIRPDLRIERARFVLGGTTAGGAPMGGGGSSRAPRQEGLWSEP
jgi:hypothetical protein